LLGDLTAAVVHRAPPIAHLAGDGLGLVDRRLGRLEFLAVLGDDARLRELRLQSLDVPLGHDRGWAATHESAVDRGSGDDRAAHDES
jgi:hypothetical protein